MIVKEGLKNQPRHLLRQTSVNFRRHCRNLSHETVPLKTKYFTGVSWLFSDLCLSCQKQAKISIFSFKVSNQKRKTGLHIFPLFSVVTICTIFTKILFLNGRGSLKWSVTVNTNYVCLDYINRFQCLFFIKIVLVYFNWAIRVFLDILSMASFKWLLPVFVAPRGGGGGSAPCS